MVIKDQKCWNVHQGDNYVYFYNDWRAKTPWGENRPDYGRAEVRQYIRDNVLFWLEEFRLDGLRLDATCFIHNTRGETHNADTDLADGWSLLQWLNEEVARFFPGRLIIAEDLLLNPWVTKTTGEGGAGFSMQWDAGFVHPIRSSVIATEDSARDMSSVANAIQLEYNGNAFSRIIYSESHDEVANGKARIPQEINPQDPSDYFAQKRSTLAAGLVFTSPGVPMIFEGQEFLEDGWFQDEVPLDWSKLENFKGINRLYRDLMQLRRNKYNNTAGLTGSHVSIFHINNIDKTIAFHRWLNGGPLDDVVVIASFCNRAFENYRVGMPWEGEWTIRFNADWKGYSPDFQNEEAFAEGKLVTEETTCDGAQFSIQLPLAPYAMIILSQEAKK